MGRFLLYISKFLRIPKVLFAKSPLGGGRGGAPLFIAPLVHGFVTPFFRKFLLTCPRACVRINKHKTRLEKRREFQIEAYI